MIPIESSTPVAGTLLAPDNLPKRPLIDYEYGGAALSDGSQGHLVQIWKCFYDKNLSTVFVEAPNTPATPIFEMEGITWLSFTFDQNMRWSAVYTLEDGTCWLKWYNSQIEDYATDNLGEGVRTPYLTFDDKRPAMQSMSDMILAYIQDTSLILRVQRERFNVRHIWSEKIPKDWIIRNFGMSNKLRLQVEIR